MLKKFTATENTQTFINTFKKIKEDGFAHIWAQKRLESQLVL